MVTFNVAAGLQFGSNFILIIYVVYGDNKCWRICFPFSQLVSGTVIVVLASRVDYIVPCFPQFCNKQGGCYYSIELIKAFFLH